jgi:hypothetical protein
VRNVPELDYSILGIRFWWLACCPSNVAAIQEFPHPSVVKELQAFLGMVNFYRRFLPDIVRMLRPLTDGLHDSKKGSDKLE